jgi:hypothetical protein
VVHYMAKYSQQIVASKLARLSPNCPLGPLELPRPTDAGVPATMPDPTPAPAVSQL